MDETLRYQLSQIGLYVGRGQEITVSINAMGITPVNLFGNSRCQDALVKLFQLSGIDVPKTDTGVYSRGAWGIKMK